MGRERAESRAGRTLVIGGGGGIGEQVALELAGRGAAVVVAGRTAAELERVAHRVRGQTEVVDVSVAGQVADLIAGLGPIETVVNTAGVQGGEGALGPIWNTEPSAVEEVFRINTLGSYHVLRESIRSMGRHRVAGSVILFSGGGAAGPRPRLGPYGASKSAVVRLTESTAAELRESGSRIRVFAVAPGAVHTGMTEEILRLSVLAGEREARKAASIAAGQGSPGLRAARLCGFLASARAAPLSGRLIHVDDDVEILLGCELPADAGCLRRVAYEPSRQDGCLRQPDSPA